MKKQIKLIVLAITALMVLCGCGSAKTDNSSYAQPEVTASEVYHEEAGADNKNVQPAATESTQKEGPESPQKTVKADGVTVNGNEIEGAAFAYTYNAAFGHYFLTTFTDDGDSVAFMAVLPENLCVSGAEYSGRDISSNGILFDVLIVGADSYCEYNSADNPEVFDELQVRIESIELYGAARFEISGNVTIDGRIARISASGQSEYVESNSQSGGESAGNSDGTCLYCGGSGVCFLCHGLGYTAWGGYSDRIDCNSCNGLGYCYYCQGTGIQVYSVKGVKINP